MSHRSGICFWRSSPTVVALALVLLGGCAQSAPREVSPTADSALATRSPVASNVLTGDQAADRARIDSLVTIARTLARADGCTSAAACRTAGLGVKACGGFKEFLVYCSATTDSVALASAVDLVNSLERDFNERYELVSDCMMLLEPRVQVEGGSCVAAPEGAGAPQ